jgi:hypothetical protein
VDNRVFQNVFKKLTYLRVKVVSICVYMIYLTELSDQQVPHPSLAIIKSMDPWFVVGLQ